MSDRKRNTTRKSSRLRVAIEPVRVEELVAAAGMSGFLGVLDPPASVPHLEKLAKGRAFLRPETEGNQVLGLDRYELSPQLSLGVEHLRSLLERQQEALLEISNIAFRMNGAATRIDRQTQVWRSSTWSCSKCTVRPVEVLSGCSSTKEDKSMKVDKTLTRGRTPKSATAGPQWQDWVSSKGVLGQAPGSFPNANPVNGSDDSLRQAISQLAYSYWESRGCQGGSPEDDWVRAEVEIHGHQGGRLEEGGSI